MEVTATNYAERISAVFNAGSNAVTYPQFDLADQLKTVAKMISGGSKTKIFLFESMALITMQIKSIVKITVTLVSTPIC